MNEAKQSEETLCARWTDDCQGKKDYDGRIISLSTRYWPRGGGFHVLSKDHKEFALSEDAAIRPSAHASIHLNFGEPDEYGYGDYRALAEMLFEADTEDEVKAQVEVWAKNKFEQIIALVDGKL
jgi:hypothetical protein